MKDTLQLKFGIILFVFSGLLMILLFDSKKNDFARQTSEQKHSKSNFERKELVNIEESDNSPRFEILAEPASFIERQGKVKGINSIVKFEKDLETSLKIQEIPNLWLEYTNENNEIVKVEFPAKAKELIKKRWQNTLSYSHQNQNTDEREIKIEINANYINDAAVLATAIENFSIITPSEKRNISRKEAFDIVNLTARLAIERYKELKNIGSQINPQKVIEQF